jgi:hypothetical protein
MTFEHIVQINDLTKPELPVLTRCPVISIFMKRMWPQTRKPFRSYGNWRRRVFSSPVPFHQPRVTAPMFPDSYRG